LGGGGNCPFPSNDALGTIAIPTTGIRFIVLSDKSHYKDRLVGDVVRSQAETPRTKHEVDRIGRPVPQISSFEIFKMADFMTDHF